MRKIYYACDADDGERRKQTIHATLVAETEGSQNRYRVTINWDTSYAFQTNGEIAVLDGLVFKPVLRLLAHEMPLLHGETIKNAAPRVQAVAVWEQAVLMFGTGWQIVEKPAP